MDNCIISEQSMNITNNLKINKQNVNVDLSCI